ncbi:MAG TPA: hypothetical protein VGE34_00775 [Candidatus Saccharimonadales bacterium]
MKLDYSALHQPVTASDISAYKQSLHRQSRPVLQVTSVVVMAIFILSVVFGIQLASSGSIQSGNFGFAAMMLGFFGFIVGIAIIATRIQTKKLAKLYKFATQNNLKLKAGVSSPGYAGTIFDEGHSRMIDQALSFPDGSEIGNYQYTTGSGKSTQVHLWTYARAPLKRQLPNMLLDSKHNNLFGTFTSLPNSMKSNQVLSLEGDFDKHFTLYAPVAYKTDALYIFTPDVMAAIIDAGKDYDMEIIGNELFLYRSQTVRIDSEQELTKILTILGKISTELLDQTDYYADKRVGDRGQDVIAQPGQRLKQRMNPLAITLVAIFLFITFAPMLIGMLVRQLG